MASKERTFSCIKCPYCHTSHAVKLWFLCGDNRTTADWVDFMTTDPGDSDCLCNVYACPQCGRITVIDAEKVVANG